MNLVRYLGIILLIWRTAIEYMKELGKTMSKFLNKTVAILGTGFVFIILLNIFIFADAEQYFCKKTFMVSNKAMMVLSFFVLLIGLVITKKTKVFEVTMCLNRKALLVASTLIFLLQIIIAYSIYFEAGWDCWAIVDTSRSFVEGTLRNGSYFGTYPNNIVLMGIFAVILKMTSLFGLTDSYFVLIIVNLILLNLSGMMIANISYKVTVNKKIASVIWIAFTVLGSLSGWMVVPYSDVWALFFVTLSFYIYSKIHDTANFVPWILLGITFFVGTQIKPTTMIGLIAILITEFITTHEDFKRRLHKLAILVITFGGIMIVFSESTERIMQSLGVDTEQRVTYTHYLMMGLQEETLGAISGEDLEFSTKITTVEERKAENLRVAKQRLQEFGVSGYAEFLRKKLLMNTNDGSFAWGLEGEFFKVIPEPTTLLSNTLRNFYYNQGNYYEMDAGKNQRYLLSFQHITWLCILIAVSGFVLKKRDANVRLESVAILSVIGILLFTLLFEGRARYLYASLPMFVITAGCGLQGFAQIKWRRK